MWSTILASSAPAGPRPAHSRATTRHTDTAAADVAGAEHGCVAQHVRDDEEADVGSADVDLVEMGDAAVAGGDGDVFELDVHVVFGCWGEVGWLAGCYDWVGDGKSGGEGRGG